MSRRKRQRQRVRMASNGRPMGKADRLVQAGMWQQMAAKPDRAMEQYLKALEIEPGHSGALFAAGLLSQHLGRKEEAARCFKASLQSEPDNADAWYNLGKMHHDLGRPDEALQCYLAALEHNEYHVHALGNAGHCFMAAGDIKAARLCWERLLARDPKSPEGIYNRSFVKLLTGDLEGGWRDYEERWNCPGYKLEYGRPDLAAVPLWTDQDMTGRTLYLHGEQGLGDQIQMLRFVPSLQALGARLVIEVLPPLVRLVEDTFPTCDVRPRQGRADLEGVDFHLPMMSCPARFGGAHPGEVPYLVSRPVALPHRAGEWIRAERERGQQVVGVVWAGSKTHPGDHARSIAATELTPLFEGREGISWLSLQIGERAQDAPWLQMYRAHDEVDDFRTSAAIVSALDGVVTVDTSTAHLAGALGVPTTILLPPVPDYRWQLVREDTDLYPSARLFRRRPTEGWGDTLTRLPLARSGTAV